MPYKPYTDKQVRELERAVHGIFGLDHLEGETATVMADPPMPTDEEMLDAWAAALGYVPEDLYSEPEETEEQRKERIWRALKEAAK